MSKGNGGQGRKNSGGKSETPVASNRVGGDKTPKEKGNGNSSTKKK
jgi:hypothetical protein